MADTKSFNEEQAKLLHKNTQKTWWIYFAGVAAFVALFLTGSIAYHFTRRMGWILLVIPGFILMALPTFLKILRGANAKGLLDTGEIEIQNVYANGYVEVDYASTNALNTGMGVLKYGLMFFVSILLTPIALVTTTVKLVKLNKAFGTEKPLLPLILDLVVVGAIIAGGVVMGTKGSEKVKDDYKGQNEKKAEILSGCRTYMASKNHTAFWDSSDTLAYDAASQTYTYNYKSGKDWDGGLDGNHVFTISFAGEAWEYKADSKPLDTLYSGERLTKAKKQLTYSCPLTGLPFDAMLADLDNVAIEKYTYNVRVQYKKDGDTFAFTIGTDLYQGNPEKSIWSFNINDDYGYSLKY